MDWSCTCIVSHHESQQLHGLSDLYMEFHFLSPYFKIQLVNGEDFSKNNSQISIHLPGNHLPL